MSNIATLIEKSVTTSFLEIIDIKPNFSLIFIACEDFPSFSIQPRNSNSDADSVSLRDPFSVNIDDKPFNVESTRQSKKPSLAQSGPKCCYFQNRRETYGNR